MDQSFRYEGGAQDEVIRQIGLALLSEMMNPMTGGRMLAAIARRKTGGSAFGGPLAESVKPTA